MASEIVLPQWGMEMQDGTIVRWLKQEGDTVAEGEPIVEVETAKLQTELESTASGVLSRIVAQEGEIVPIRGVLCVIAEPGEELTPSAAPAAPASASPEPATQVAPASNGVGAPGVQVVPAARRLARERGVDLAQVRGSGPNGRILLADVESAALQAPAAPAAEPAGRVPVVPAARRLARQNDIDLSTVTGSGPQGRILIEDLEAIDAGTKSRFRRSLRVKRVHRVCSVWELTWAPDGRATFTYGKPVLEGLTHIQWRRCGSHAILRNP